MRNRTSQSLFRPRLPRQPVGPGRPASAAAPYFPRWGSFPRLLPQMAGRRVGCACICPPRLRDLAAPSPLRPYARALRLPGTTYAPSLRSPWRAAIEPVQPPLGSYHKIFTRQRSDIHPPQVLLPCRLPACSSNHARHTWVIPSPPHEIILAFHGSPPSTNHAHQSRIV